MRTKFILFFLLTFYVGTTTRAYDFGANGLYYNITGTNTVEVTYVENGQGNADFYYNAITIPKRVSNNNTTYNVTRIGGDAFAQCYNLTSITIPSSVTSIGGSAFEGCKGLTSVTIPEGVTSIGSSAFSGCSGLTSVTIPSSVTSIGRSAFFNCSGLTSITILEGVTSIGDSAFQVCTGLTSITIPEGVTSIGDRAFSGCSGLTSITIPSSVTSIGNSAFYGCKGLTSVTIPSSVTSIGGYAFSGCSGLTSVTVCNETPVSINEYTFSNRANATLYVPYGGKAAYEAADYWKDFKEIKEIGADVVFTAQTAEGVDMTFKVISENEKTCMVGLEEDNVASITETYNGGITIPSVVNGYTVKRIGKWAFSWRGGLTSVSIPETVESIGFQAFIGAGMTAITLPGNLKTIGFDAFSECTSLTSVNIPASVTSIRSHAFYHCSGLTSVTLNEGLLYIENNAFNGCTSLTEITIPSSVKEIHEQAFGWCTGLTSVTLLGKPSQHFSNIAFMGCDNLTTFRCDGITMTPVAGVYQIGTAEELHDFAILSTAANCSLNACLTADIDYTAYTYGGNWYNMGMNGYAGTFDGQGHTITINVVNTNSSWDEQTEALFNKLVNGSMVKNLRVAGRIESLAKFSAGIAQRICNATISHCVIDVDLVSLVEGDCTDGGIAAHTYDDNGNVNTIEYCVVAGSFQGAKANCRGGLVGWIHSSNRVNFSNCLFVADVDGLDMTDSYTWARNMDGRATVTNCYYLSKLGPADTGIQTNQDELTSGELCWLLNGESSENPQWFQTLGEDNYPVPFNTHRTVFSDDGKSFANTQTFDIASAQDLIDFAAKVNAGQTDICARLTADINLSGKTYTAIGTRDNPFVGTFDGQGHKISNLHIDVEADNQGLIGVAGGGATIKNVTMDKTCSIKATRYAAGIVGATYTSGTLTIENCGNEASVTCLRENAAGIYGSNIGNYTTIVIRNSYNAGTITGGWESAAISGWVGESSTITNSYNIGEVTGLDETNTFYRGNATVSNCYETIGSQVAQVTASDVTSGRLCWLLSGGNTENPVWRQNLSEANSHPVPNVKGRIVYKDGSSYYNEPDKNYLQMAATQIRPGGSTILSIGLTNEESITAMQFELSLPAGVSVSSAELTGRKNDHTVGYKQAANGNYQFTVFSGSSNALSGNEGAIMNITLNAVSEMSLGDYTMRLTNIELTTLGAKALYPMDCASTLTVTNSIKLGDVNGDDKISITDAVGIVNYILGSPSATFHAEAADVNGDSKISITDAVAVVNIILNQSAGVKERRTIEMETEREPQ